MYKVNSASSISLRREERVEKKAHLQGLGLGAGTRDLPRARGGSQLHATGVV